MSILQDISKRLLDVSNIPPEQRNDALMQVLIYIEEVQYDMVLEQKNLIMSVIEDLIAENDAEQIAKSKLVFVEDVEEQIAPTKKTRAKKVVKPVSEGIVEDLPDFIDIFPTIKDLPEPIKKLAGFRRKEIHKMNLDTLDTDTMLSGIFNFNSSPEGNDFWSKINNEGDLREFKKKFGNKGEKVDDLIEFAELNDFVEGLSQPVASGDLPDTIVKFSQIKDLPKPVKKLALFRQKEAENTKNENINLINSLAFRWSGTPEDFDFWDKISEGNLTEFKKKYGNKGEGVDAIINTPAVKVSKAKAPKLPKAPVVASQEVYSVDVVIYPPSGGVLELKVFSLTELFALTSSFFDKIKMNNLWLNFKANTDLGQYTTRIELKNSDGLYEVFRKLTEQYDTFVVPKLNWDGFEVRKLVKDRVDLNDEILSDTWKSKATTVPVVTPKVVTPKPVKVVAPKVVTPKPVKVVAPKVVAPKPVKVVAPKVVKTKVTKPKVEDDLSFLDDLNNIF